MPIFVDMISALRNMPNNSNNREANDNNNNRDNMSVHSSNGKSIGEYI